MCVPSLPLGQPQAQEDEDNGPQCLGQDGLVQDKGRGNQRNDWGEIDVDIGGYGADEGHGPVPADKAQGRGGQTQVEDVEDHHGLVEEGG